MCIVYLDVSVINRFHSFVNPWSYTNKVTRGISEIGGLLLLDTATAETPAETEKRLS